MNTILTRYFQIGHSTKYILVTFVAITLAILLGIMLGLNYWIIVPIILAGILFLLSLYSPNVLVWILIVSTLAEQFFNIEYEDTNISIPIIVMFLIVANRIFWFRFSWKTSFLNAPILFLLILHLIYSFDLKNNGLTNTWLFVTFLFIFYFFLYDIMVRGKRIQTLVWVWILTNSVIVFLGLLSLLSGIREFSILGLEIFLWNEGDSRLLGLSLNPNYFVILALFSSAMLFFLSSSYRGPKKIFILGLVVLNIAGAAFTQSRAALLGFVIGLLLIVFRDLKTQIFRTIPIFIFIIILVFTTANILGYNLTARFTPEYYEDTEELGDVSRWMLVSTGINIFLNNPLGSGFGSMNDLMWQKLGVAISVHNLYLASAIEQGLFGIMVWIWLAWITLYKLWKISGSQGIDPLYKNFAMGFFVAMTTIWVNYLAHSFVNWIPLWIILGLLSAFVNEVDEKQRRSPVLSFAEPT